MITRTRIFRLSFVLIILFSLLAVSVSPLAEGSVHLKVYERKIRAKNHRSSNLTVCNVTDRSSDNYGLISSKLPDNVAYRVNSLSTPSSVKSVFPTVVSNSFSTWGTLTNGVLFTNSGATSINRARNDGQNIVAWSRLSRSTLGVTYIWYNPDSGTVINVDTLLNSRLSWSWTNPNSVDEDQFCPTTNTYDVQNILVHELGHWVGLGDLYDQADEDLTMYGYGSLRELKKDTLESGDTLGVQSIYSP